jgi:hypothetical protein
MGHFPNCPATLICQKTKLVKSHSPKSVLLGQSQKGVSQTERARILQVRFSVNYLTLSQVHAHAHARRSMGSLDSEAQPRRHLFFPVFTFFSVADVWVNFEDMFSRSSDSLKRNLFCSVGVCEVI